MEMNESNKIGISRETKIMLLNVLKNGYFEMSDLGALISDLYSEVPDDELNSRISELQRKLVINRLGIGTQS